MATPKTTEFELVQPRFVSIRPHGTLDGDEALGVMDAVTANVTGEPYFLFEVFMAEVDGVSPEARRLIAQRLQALPDRAIALIGCNFAQKILAKLVLTAVSMLGGNTRNAAEFFADRESARVWLRSYAAARDAALQQQK